jgi:hypothetical protein
MRWPLYASVVVQLSIAGCGRACGDADETGRVDTESGEDTRDTEETSAPVLPDVVYLGHADVKILGTEAHLDIGENLGVGPSRYGIGAGLLIEGDGPEVSGYDWHFWTYLIDSFEEPCVSLGDPPGSGSEVAAFGGLSSYFPQNRIGDQNGDGIEDLAMGYNLDADPPSVTVFFGPVSGVLYGEDGDVTLYNDVADVAFLIPYPVGDIDGDGVIDILVTETTEDGGDRAGNTYLFYGPLDTSRVFSSADWSVPSAYDYNAEAVALGDVNADGYDDFFLQGQDGACIFLGPVSPGEAEEDADAHIEDLLTHEGYALRNYHSAGDVDGDGRADLLVCDDGLSNAEFPEADRAGGAYVLLGPLSGTLDMADVDVEIRVWHDRGGELVGYSGSGVGDVNGDGFGDILLGAPDFRIDYDGAIYRDGSAYLFLGPLSGRIGAYDADVIFVGEESGDQAGYAVLGPGDLNGDGLADFAITSPRYDEPIENAGAVYVVFGRQDIVEHFQALSDPMPDPLR